MAQLKMIRGDSDHRDNVVFDYARQAERLGFERSVDSIRSSTSSAIEAKFVTPQDPIIVTANGGRLPAVPVDEAVKLNDLRHRAQGLDPKKRPSVPSSLRKAKDGALHGIDHGGSPSSEKPDAPLSETTPASKTNPLFPPLPMWGPPTPLRSLQAFFFRFSSAILSLCFLGVIILGAIFTTVPKFLKFYWMRATFRDPYASRPFREEEKRREQKRQKADREWHHKMEAMKHCRCDGKAASEDFKNKEELAPTEGGPDRVICDAPYYARRVGLDMEMFKVQTEDGFILSLWHVYDPREYTPQRSELRHWKSPDVFQENRTSKSSCNNTSGSQYKDGQRRYPVLLMHGLLQSAGAYCCTDDDSLAFYLAKSGYDVWLGNNRCGFEPEHTMLEYGDPRMWAWNIRQMGVLDLPAFISRVLKETGFKKLGLVAHSQGTTQTLVALAKEQRPDIGEKISVFCALAPAAYAGTLIRKMYFKFMQIITPAMFRLMFGIHSFIPFMMQMHSYLPGYLYGVMGYLVFSFLFDWSDLRWDRGLRNRLFQFSPVYVSAECMRWWLGRECFASQKCILSTRTKGKLEDEEDDEEDDCYSHTGRKTAEAKQIICNRGHHHHEDRGKFAWYDERAPPMGFWIGGADHLVDGRRLLKRFERGREPHVKVVHQKIIEGYEHLDVIWAMDSIEKVGSEVKEVLWKTMPDEARRICRTPTDCDAIKPWSSGSNRTVVEETTRAPHEDTARRAKEDEEVPGI